MAKRHGRDSVVYLDGFEVSGDSNSVEPQIEVDAADVLCFGDASHSFVLGADGGRIAHAGFYNDLATTGIHAVLSARKGSAVVYGVAFGPEVQGAYGFAGTARLATYQVGAPVGGAVALANQLTPMGGVDPVVVHQPKANLTGTTTPQDHGAASSGGLRAYLQTLSVLGGTPQVVVYHGTANGSWTALGSFTAQAARAAELLVAAGNVNRWLMGSVQNGSANVWLAYRRP